MTIISKS